MKSDVVMSVDDALQYADSIPDIGSGAVSKVLAAEVRRLRDVKTCEWEQDCDDCELFETGCGHTFQFIDGSPADNDFKNCPFCGGLLDVSRQ